MAKDVFASVKIPVVGTLGVGTGAVAGTFAAEWTARSTGQVAWNAAGVKAGVKFALGLLFFGISKKLGGVVSSFFFEMMCYGSWGSIFFDIAMAAYPGGIPGMAEDVALTTRSYAAGGERIIKELGTIERKVAPQEVISRGRGWK
jgi:hypothetical protein